MGGYNLFSTNHGRKHLTWAACMGVTALLSIQSTSIASPQTEVHVTLLGQPCLIQGPFDETILKSIHSMGPAQIYPTFTSNNIPSSLEQSRKALEKIRSSSGLHALLDRYREKLRKRLEAQVAFLTALLQSQKANKNSFLLKTAGQYLQVRELQTLEGLLKKKQPSSNKLSDKLGTLSTETLDVIFDLFNDSIEPDPEAEFHRAIKKLGIQYTCAFEGNEEATSE